MTKKIETDLHTFIKFWLVPLGIILTIFFMYKAATGLIIVGASIFLALALKPLVRKVNNFFTKCFGNDKKHPGHEQHRRKNHCDNLALDLAEEPLLIAFQ